MMSIVHNHLHIVFALVMIVLSFLFTFWHHAGWARWGFVAIAVVLAWFLASRELDGRLAGVGVGLFMFLFFARSFVIKLLFARARS